MGHCERDPAGKPAVRLVISCLFVLYVWDGRQSVDFVLVRQLYETETRSILDFKATDVSPWMEGSP